MFVLLTLSYYLLLLLDPYHFCSLFCHLCIKYSLGIYNFLEETFSLPHSVVFLYFFALITEEFFLISSCYSLKLCIQMLISFLFSCFLLLFFSQLFVRPPQTAILPFCISFPWGWSWSLPPVPCHELPSIVLRHSIYQIWSLESISHFHCNRKGFDLGHTWMV